MRRFIFHKRFEKQYSLLKPAQKEKVKNALSCFVSDEKHPSLRTHKLSGKYKGQISISAGGDLRIHLLECEDSVYVLVLQVGSHSQLYGK